MKITPQDQAELERLMLQNIKLMSAAQDFNEFFDHWRACVDKGALRRPIKCEATAACSYLMRLAALRYLCDVVYEYAHDTHLHTFYRALYKKYSGDKKLKPVTD